jgi:hypothetical protein
MRTARLWSSTSCPSGLVAAARQRQRLTLRRSCGSSSASLTKRTTAQPSPAQPSPAQPSAELTLYSSVGQHGCCCVGCGVPDFSWRGWRVGWVGGAASVFSQLGIQRAAASSLQHFSYCSLIRAAVLLTSIHFYLLLSHSSNKRPPVRSLACAHSRMRSPSAACLPVSHYSQASSV